MSQYTKYSAAGGGGGGGGVTAVTASSPLASSGGATPNITLNGTVLQSPLEALSSYNSNYWGPGGFVGNVSDLDQTNQLVLLGSTDTAIAGNATSSVVIIAGDNTNAAATGNAGFVYMQGGNIATGSGNPGGASMYGGNGNSAQGGPIYIQGGNSVTGMGGDVRILAGSPSSGTQRGGEINIEGGSANSGLGGNINLTAGSGTSRGIISLNGLSINANSSKINNVTDPTSAQDAATKNYVDTHFNTSLTTQTINLQNSGAITQSSLDASTTHTLPTGGQVVQSIWLGSTATGGSIGILSGNPASAASGAVRLETNIPTGIGDRASGAISLRTGTSLNNGNTGGIGIQVGTPPGTGTRGDITAASRNIILSADTVVNSNNSPIKIKVYTVATLPAAATVGAGSKAFVSDATVTTFASIVAGSGANFVPVFTDGTNWFIG